MTVLCAGWPHKKLIIWTAFALGVIAALGAGTLLLRPLIAKSLRAGISRKRMEVEEASHAAKPSEVSSLKVIHSSEADSESLRGVSVAMGCSQKCCTFESNFYSRRHWRSLRCCTAEEMAVLT